MGSHTSLQELVAHVLQPCPGHKSVSAESGAATKGLQIAQVNKQESGRKLSERQPNKDMM